MNKKEFLEKWGYQSAAGYGSALVDCRNKLEEDLNELIKSTREDVMTIINKCSDVQNAEDQLKLLTISLRFWEDGETVDDAVAIAAEFISKAETK